MNEYTYIHIYPMINVIPNVAMIAIWLLAIFVSFKKGLQKATSSLTKSLLI